MDKIEHAEEDLGIDFERIVELLNMNKLRNQVKSKDIMRNLQRRISYYLCLTL